MGSYRQAKFHLHDPYDMLWDEDFLFCCCRVCEFAWERNSTKDPWTPREYPAPRDSRAKREHFAAEARSKKTSSSDPGRRKYYRKKN